MFPQNDAASKSSKFRTAVIAVAAPALLMIVGAGCKSLGQKANDVSNELSDEAVAPTVADFEALGKAKEAAAETSAKMNEDADRASDDLAVAMIVTENASAPAGAIAVPGAIGCNDRVAYLRLHREASTDSVLADALATLFAQKDSNVGGLYNALWQTTFKVDKINSGDGVTTNVYIKGDPISGGACDNPRIKAQIEATVRRLKPKFRVFLNGKESEYRCIGKVSGECK